MVTPRYPAVGFEIFGAYPSNLSGCVRYLRPRLGYCMSPPNSRCTCSSEGERFDRFEFSSLG